MKPIGSMYGICLIYLPPDRLKQTPDAPQNRPGPKRKRERIASIHFQVLLMLVSRRYLYIYHLKINYFYVAKYGQSHGSYGKWELTQLRLGLPFGGIADRGRVQRRFRETQLRLWILGLEEKYHGNLRVPSPRNKALLRDY